MIVSVEYDCVLPIIDASDEAERVRCRSEYKVTPMDNGMSRYFLVHGKTDVVMRYTAEELEEMYPTQQPADVIPFCGKIAEKARLSAVA